MPDSTAAAISTTTPTQGLPQTAIELSSVLGIGVMVLLSLFAVCGVLYLLMRGYMEGETKKWETREQHTSTIYRDMISQVTASRDRDLAILKDALDDNRDQITLLRSIVEKQKASDRALQAILDKISTLLEDRCRHHLALSHHKPQTPNQKANHEC